MGKSPGSKYTGCSKKKAPITPYGIVDAPDQELARHIFASLSRERTNTRELTRNERKVSDGLGFIMSLLRDAFQMTTDVRSSRKRQQVLISLSLIEALLYGKDHPIFNYVKGIRSIKAPNRPLPTVIEQVIKCTCVAYLEVYAKLAGVSKRKAADALVHVINDTGLERITADSMRKYGARDITDFTLPTYEKVRDHLLRNYSGNPKDILEEFRKNYTDLRNAS